MGVDSSCKRSVLKTLSDMAAHRLGVKSSGLLESLIERERLGSTGIGHGIAVPHARAETESLRGFMMRLRAPVDFDSVDDRPVDLVFLLVAPQAANTEHLKALSRIARLCREERMQKAMRGAADAAALYAIAVGDADAAAA